MRQTQITVLFIIAALALVGCKSTPFSVPATQENQDLFPIVSSQTPTVIHTLTSSISPTPFNGDEHQGMPTAAPTVSAMRISTLEPEKADEAIRAMLREPVDCPDPCFWGITPGKTTSREAIEKLRYYGLEPSIVLNEGKNDANAAAENHHIIMNLTIPNDDTEHFGLNAYLTIANNFVESVKLSLSPDRKKSVRSEWLAYSPDTLIKRYGLPSRVDLIALWDFNPHFAMNMYFDSADLIVQYGGDYIITGDKGLWRICPLTAQFEWVWLWMGKNPSYPPVEGIHIEKAAFMTIEEFARLLTEDAEEACIYFHEDIFLEWNKKGNDDNVENP
jgi:hypothetical protein